MNAWIVLAAASVLTLALRAGPSLIQSCVALPSVFQRANRFAAPALMGALASRSAVAHAAATDRASTLAAIAIAVPIALWTRSMAITLAVGAATLLTIAAIP
jgi:branched-subunit amino acid transport protein